MYNQKIPGRIKLINQRQIEKCDKQVYYNADVYTRKGIYGVQYEQELSNKLPIKSTKQRTTLIEKELRQGRKPNEIIMNNIHGQFDLSAYQQLYQIYKTILKAMETNQFQIVSSCRKYLQFVAHHHLDDVSQLKFIPDKREIIKKSLQKQRLTIIIICFSVAIDQYQNLKPLCIELLINSFEAYLVTLYLLVKGKDEYVKKLLQREGKQNLSTQGFQFISALNEVMKRQIYNIAQTDTLFAGQFLKIIEAYSSYSIKSLFYSVTTFFSFFVNAVEADQKLYFLSVAPAPFLPQDQPERYTLVIDFIHVFLDQSITVKQHLKRDEPILRPYSHYFLTQMQKYYDIISYCDLMPVECNQIINRINEKVVKERLYKYHIDHQQKGRDMAKIGCNLNRLIFIDSFSDETNQNLLLVHPWKGDPGEAQLVQICPLLAMIAVKKLSTPQSLKKIREAIAGNQSLGLKYMSCGVNLE